MIDARFRPQQRIGMTWLTDPRLEEMGEHELCIMTNEEISLNEAVNEEMRDESPGSVESTEEDDVPGIAENHQI